MDLVSTQKITVKEQDKILLVPTGVWGPLPEGTVGLILGRSSIIAEEILVQLRVVDSDYQEESKIMISLWISCHSCPNSYSSTSSSSLYSARYSKH